MDYILAAVPVFFLLIFVEILTSRWAGKTLYRFNDAIANINCGIVQQVSSVLFGSALFLGYLYLYNNWRLVDIPNNFWTWMLLFIGIDFLYYWFHRYSHEINLFWGAHVVHHQSEDYNLTVALRQSSFQVIFSSIFYLPLALIGFDPYAFITVNSLQTIYQFWIHTEMIDKLPWPIEYIFCTPSHHRVHHGRNPEYIDKNHGGTLIIWDRMFGTFEPERAPVVYGVTKPLKSWNPVRANVDYYKDLYSLSLQMNRLQDKLRLFIARPGWRPDYLGGMERIPEVVRENFKKYDTSLRKNLYTFVAFEFLVLLVCGIAFLLTAESLSYIQQMVVVVWLLWMAVDIASTSSGGSLKPIRLVGKYGVFVVGVWWLLAY